MKFEYGEIIATMTISTEMSENPRFFGFVYDCLDRHTQGDWGDCCAEDKALNGLALDEGDRIFSVYKSEEFGVVYVITEADRSATCVLRPSDY